MLTDTLEKIKVSGDFSLPTLVEVLKEIKANSFYSQLEIQRDAVNLEKYSISAASFTFKKLNRDMIPIRRAMIGTVNHSFINPSKKLKYRHSSHFDKPLSMIDITKDTDTFTSNFFVYTDLGILDFVRIIPRDNTVDIVIDVTKEGTKQLFKHIVELGLDIHIIFLPNTEFGIYQMDYNTIKKNKQHLHGDNPLSAHLSTELEFNTFVNDNMVTNAVFIEPTSAALIKGFENSKTNHAPHSVDTVNKAKVNTYGFNQLIKVIDLPESVEPRFFRINGLKMPVPLDNMFAIYRDENINDVDDIDKIMLNHYYPNIYKVGPGKAVRVFVFYNKNNFGVKGFHNELAPFYEFISDDELKNVDLQILEYMPGQIDFDIKDFKASSFYPDYKAYQIDKFSFIIDETPEFLRNFLMEVVADNRYVIPMSTIDLTKRIRYNNHTEIKDVSIQTDFDEAHYVIILKRGTNNEDLSNLRFFIDGLFYYPKFKWLDDKYEFYYFPKSIVKDDSVIEVERYEAYFYKKAFVPTLEAPKLHVIGPDNYYGPRDIYVVKEDGTVVPGTDYKISYIEEEVETFVETDAYTPIPTIDFYVTITNEELFTVKLDVHVNSVNSVTETINDVSDGLYENAVTLKTVHRANKVRLFKNGRFTPEYSYMKRETGVFGEPMDVHSKVLSSLNDRWSLDYIPVEYRKVIEYKTIPEPGVIDLYGIIRKPFDLRYFDIFVNGRKLNKTNIEIISPFIIKLKNLVSLNELYIYERVSSKDVFIIGEGKMSMMDKIMEIDPIFKDKIFSYISETEPNLDLEEDNIQTLFSDLLLELFLFYNNDMKKKISRINPDDKTLIDDLIIASYPTIFSSEHIYSNDILHINPSVPLVSDDEIGAGNGVVFRINPDIKNT